MGLASTLNTPPLQIPGGWAAQLYGGRIMLVWCFFLWSCISLLTPSDGNNTTGIIIARVCIGISQGFLIPAVHTVLSQVRQCRQGRARGSGIRV